MVDRADPREEVTARLQAGGVGGQAEIRLEIVGFLASHPCSTTVCISSTRCRGIDGESV